MRLPLIVVASPSKIKESPSILLSKGKWKAEHNCKDTKFVIATKQLGVQSEHDSEKEIYVEHFCEAKLIVVTSGNETSISIDIVRISS